MRTSCLNCCRRRLFKSRSCCFLLLWLKVVLRRYLRDLNSSDGSLLLRSDDYWRLLSLNIIIWLLLLQQRLLIVGSDSLSWILSVYPKRLLYLYLRSYRSFLFSSARARTSLVAYRLRYVWWLLLLLLLVLVWKIVKVVPLLVGSNTASYRCWTVRVIVNSSVPRLK